MIHYLIIKARSFIYSTALPTAVIGASLAAVRLIQKEPELREELWKKVSYFKMLLQNGGIKQLGESQIIPVLIGESEKALSIAYVNADGSSVKKYFPVK